MKTINYVFEVAGKSQGGKLSSAIDRALQTLGFEYRMLDGQQKPLCEIIESIQKIEGDVDYILVSLPMTALLSPSAQQLN